MFRVTNENQNYNYQGQPIPTKEIGELLEIVSAKAPKLISDLLGTLYSEEAGTRIGKAVGNFYKELQNSGIPAEEALRMTKDYMNYVKSVATEMVPKNISTNYNTNGPDQTHYRP
jgi:hypothetical protein